MHFLVPAGIDNPARPSGGNVYDRRLSTALATLGWQVVEHPVSGSWPRPDPDDAHALAAVLTSLPDGALVLVDGLMALTGSSLPHHSGRLRVVVLVHMLFATLDDGGTRLALERTVLRCAAAVVTTSLWTKRQVIDRHGLDPERIAVVEPGTDQAGLARGTAGGSKLLCVGPVTAAKGYETLIDALMLVDGHQWECTCAGALDIDPAIARELRQRVEEGGLGDRVHFTGPLTTAELSARYAAADVLLLASRHETFGMVVTEALARGIPVIATDVGGIPEAMGRGASGNVPGLLVPPDDPTAFAAALRRWFQNAQLRGELRHAAAQRRETLEGWDTAARRLSAVLSPLSTARTPDGTDPSESDSGISTGSGTGAGSSTSTATPVPAPRPWRTAWRWLQPLGGVAVLAALLWTLGTGPFLHGIKSVAAPTVAAAAAIMFLTTLASAWRWRLVAGRLGQDIPVRAAVASYYRSQFLNSVLPGGVLGDVHRGVVHGRTRGGVGTGLRAVVWERAAGQVVQLVLAVAVLAVFPSPLDGAAGVLAVILLVAGATTVVLVALRSVTGATWWAAALRTIATDLRTGLLNRYTAPAVVLASTVAVAGYTAVFLMAARAAGVEATVAQLLPLAVFVLLAMSIPASIAGWGPREGAAAWAFSMAGLGAAQGVGAAVVYGVLSFAAVLPGAAVLLLDRARRRGMAAAPAPAPSGNQGGTGA